MSLSLPPFRISRVVFVVFGKGSSLEGRHTNMDQLVKDVEECERIGQEIMSLRGEIIALDSKRNKNREALR